MIPLSSLDLETWAPDEAHQLQPWRADKGARISSIATYDESMGRCGHLWPSVDDLRAALEMGETSYIVTWNGVFDIAWLVGQGLREEVRACKWLDGMLLYKRVDKMRQDLARENKRKAESYGLKAAVSAYYPSDAGYEQDVTFRIEPGDDSSPEAKKLLAYNKLDARHTYFLAQKFLSMLPENERAAVLIEAAMLVPMAESWVDGVPLNVPQLKDLAFAYSDKMRALEEVLRTHGLTPEIIASSQQLGNYLYEENGLTAPIKTATGANSANKAALTSLAHDDSRPRLILDYRALNTRATKYVEGPLDSILYNGGTRTHPQPKIAGTYTGRVTYSGSQGKGKKKVATGIALHQWAREKEIRSVIKAPDGFQIAEFDFSGQEMRLIADLSGDPTMLDYFNHGKDLHSLMGANIKQLPYETVLEQKDGDMKPTRYLGKFVNLSFQYRISAASARIKAETQYGINMQLSEAEHAKAVYLNTYKGVPGYWAAAVQVAKRMGYAETRGGRKVALEKWTGRDAWGSEQTAINFPIQGTGGDQKALALATAWPLVMKMGGFFGWDLHDGLYFFLPDQAHIRDNVLELKHIMSNLDYAIWRWTPRLAFPVDSKLGPTWGELKDIE